MTCYTYFEVLLCYTHQTQDVISRCIKIIWKQIDELATIDDVEEAATIDGVEDAAGRKRGSLAILMQAY
jgi:hypothetical protein